MPAGGGGGGGGRGAGEEGEEAEAWELSPGIRLGSAIRDASRAELGLVLSVGVATNKLLAKLVRSFV
jgi:nucleotidyltransferase/DNA polymerase involved in DNA repair